MINKIWKDIKGYEGLYQISNLGIIKSLNRAVNSRLDNEGNPIMNIRKGRFLKQTINNQGYYRIILYKSSISKSYFIHKLLGIHFIDNPDNKDVVNHIDGNPSNNKLSNLEWATYSEDKQHAVNTGLIHSGGNNYNAKSINQYTLNGIFIKTWESMMDIKRDLGIDNRYVSAVCRNKQKTACGFKWKYNIKDKEDGKK